MTRLHLGCGTVRLDGWINVDLDSPVADLRIDLREPLPFADASIDLVYGEHFIEHIDRHEAVALLRECIRVMAPGGTLRVSTPSLEHLAACYLRRDITGWGELWQPSSPCRLLNEGMRAWGHIFVYDAEELEAMLHEAGFAQVAFMRWRQSGLPALRGLETRPDHDDLIVEARVLAETGSTAPPEPPASPVRTAQRSQGGYLGEIERQAVELPKAAERESQLRAQIERTAEEIEALRADRDRVVTHAGNLEAEIVRFRTSAFGIMYTLWRRLITPRPGTTR